MGSVLEYQEAFEELTFVVPGLSEFSIVSFFISRLKPELRRELLIAKPMTLLDAMSLVRLQKTKFQELRKDHSKQWERNTTQTFNT